MKQKLFTILTLLLCICSTAWADAITVTWLPDGSSSSVTSKAGTASVNNILTVSDLTTSTDIKEGPLSKQYTTGESHYYGYFTATTGIGSKGKYSKDDYITFAVTVKEGYVFTPTNATVQAIGIGTGDVGAGIFATIQTANGNGTIGKGDSSNQNPTTLTLNTFSSESYSAGQTLYFYVHIGAKNDGKSVGLRDVTLTGTYDVAKNATTEILKTNSAVKVGAATLSKDAGSNGYGVSGNTITLTDDQAVWAAPSNIKLVKTVTYDDDSTADVDVPVSFDGTVTDGYYIGTASIGLTGSVTAYTVRVMKKGGWKLFDGSVDTDFASSPITYKNVSVTYSVTGSKSSVDVSTRTNNIGNGKSYTIGYSMSTTSSTNNYISFTIPTGYNATFTHAFAGTGNNRTIVLSSAVVTSTDADDYIATLATTPSSGGSGVINGGEYSTPLTAGTYYICGIGGGWVTVELNFNLTETNDPPATITFDPVTGSSVGEGSEITLSSAGATTIKYQWGSSVVNGEGDWSSAATYSEENKPEVPAYGSANNVLSVKASNNHGDTYGSATYSISAPTITITKGTHANGDFTINPSSAAEGEEVTLTATPNLRYLFDSWSVYKTDDPTTTVTVTNNKFTMPAYAVTVDATFTADPKKQVLYLTSNGNVNANDKLYAALAEDYTVTKAAFDATKTVTDFDLVVFHESIGGGNYNKNLVDAAIKADVPVLNTKSYFYGADQNANDRWKWGAPNEGTSVTGATINPAYGNIASHPIFDGVDISDAGFVTLFNAATAKAMQPVTALASGKEGYTLAITPNVAAVGGNGVAIHELSAAQRGLSSGSAKYLMVSIGNGNGCFEKLTANGQKLLKNAAAYLIDNTASWTPTTSVSGTITASGWNTFSSYATLDLSKINGGAAYVASATSGNSVTLTPVTDKIVAAGTGLMIKGTAGEAFTIDATSAAANFEGTNLLVGMPNGGEVAKADNTNTWNYVFGWTDPADPGFYLVNAKEPTLGAGKAYLQTTAALSTTTPARLNIVFEGETTGISNVDANDNIDANAPMYNLAGQRVNKSYKGVVIVNGKKMLNK